MYSSSALEDSETGAVDVRFYQNYFFASRSLRAKKKRRWFSTIIGNIQTLADKEPHNYTVIRFVKSEVKTKEETVFQPKFYNVKVLETVGEIFNSGESITPSFTVSK